MRDLTWRSEGGKHDGHGGRGICTGREARMNLVLRAERADPTDIMERAERIGGGAMKARDERVLRHVFDQLDAGGF